MDTSNIVSSKENIQPLRSGRATIQLQAAIQAQTDTDMKQALQMKRNEFELMLRNPDPEDPLAAWCDYAIWIEQSYLHQPKEGKLTTVLKKCITKFKNNEAYMNDTRFIKLCIKYADLEDKTLELLGRLHGHGIGRNCADFYIAWAERYAVAGQFKQANLVYEAGRKNKAEPTDLLEAAVVNLHLFLGRRMLGNKEEFQSSTLDSNIEQSLTRQPYNVLRQQGQHAGEAAPTVRVGDNVVGGPGKMAAGKVLSANHKTNSVVQVFEDPDGQDLALGKAKLAKLPGQKTNKENSLKPGVWTNSKTGSVPFTVPTKQSSFQVHEDDNAGGSADAKPKVMVSTTALQPKSTCYEDPGYANAPMFYEEPVNPTQRYMCCRDKMYAGGVELQLEELRVITYTKTRQERLRRKREEEEERQRQEMEEAEQRMKEERQRREMKEAEQRERVERHTEEPVENQLRLRKENALVQKKSIGSKRFPAARQEPVLEFSAADSTYDHTIHTKEALTEMQQLWFAKSPTPCFVPEKQQLKTILKPTKISFQPFVDESCLNAAGGAPLDLSVKTELQQPTEHNVEESEEGKENHAPSGYAGPVGKSTRPVTGVLTPSDNVPLPDSDSDDESDDKTSSDEEKAIGQVDHGDHGVTENFTRAFKFPKGSSTPNFRRSIRPTVAYNDESVFMTDFDKEESQRPVSPQTDGKLNEKRPGAFKNLSAIVETSREYKSSSSGSSGVSTLGRPSKNFPYTPSVLRNESNRFTSFQSDKTKGYSTMGYEASSEATGHRLAVVKETELQIKPDAVQRLSLKEPVVDVSDPFSDQLIQQLLDKAQFRKHAGPKACFSDKTLRPAKLGSTLALGNGESLDLKKVLGEGSYAKVFLATSQNGQSVVVKYQKPACPWEFYITEEIQKRLRDTDKASHVSYFMCVDRAYFFSNASLLLTTPLEFGDLLSVRNKLQQGNVMSHILAMYLTVQMLDIVETLHGLSIIHADIKPDNFLLVMDASKKLQLQLIDFGRSIDMNLLPAHTNFTKVVTTEQFTCIEMQTGRPWTYQTDLYGLANCSHCLLFGEYMKVVNKRGIWSIAKMVPRYYAVKEWKGFFHDLLNIESCDKLPVLSSMRDSFNVALESEQSGLRRGLTVAATVLKNR